MFDGRVCARSRSLITTRVSVWLSMSRPRSEAKTWLPRWIASHQIGHYRALSSADNGSEFISKALDRWAYENGVEIDFSRPGKPTDNAKNESFNGRFREECLNSNSHWFLSLEDARCKIDVWPEYYNEARPHSALQWMTPAELARQQACRANSAHPTEPDISNSERCPDSGSASVIDNRRGAPKKIRHCREEARELAEHDFFYRA
ncbi:hypothetical protein BN2476_630120 [Paraburkholderia piptadeniae]|uniref:Integrase catalytic domain-containing protein n=1 Tax=Paraburkholderia piptadeniae TaxID=1701573 RepID=A0A1N7SLM5_9BURK|nr:hypothetical protein BN2476_630120 [Paraburkholderia piptadeniae]